MDDLELCLYDLESFQTIWKVSGRSKKCPDHSENVARLSKILQNHLLCAYVADLKIDEVYALHPEGFCDKNLAIRKVFAFCDSDHISFLSDASPIIAFTLSLAHLTMLLPTSIHILQILKSKNPFHFMFILYKNDYFPVDDANVSNS